MSGLGLVIMQESTVRQAVRKGDLVPLLTDHEVSPTEFDTALYAVYPSSRKVSPKTRAFVDFLVTLFRHHDERRT
jgi:DNA-binding transcriptional LysR family regulator